LGKSLAPTLARPVWQALLEAGADPNAHGDAHGATALHLLAGSPDAARDEPVAMLRALLRAGADINATGELGLVNHDLDDGTRVELLAML
jgi:ankyrin repeat protein